MLRDGTRCYYADEDAISPLWKGQRFEMSQCISGWAMLNRRSAVIEDIYADDRIPHDAYRRTFVKSLACARTRSSSRRASRRSSGWRSQPSTATTPRTSTPSGSRGRPR